MSNKFSTLTRKNLYDEVWQISVRNVAEKYDVPYQWLLKLCKSNNVPIPNSGYWTKITFGKPVEVIPLPEPENETITLPIKTPARNASNPVKPKNPDKKPQNIEKVKAKPTTNYLVPDIATLGNPEVIKEYQTEYNIYHRDILYDEVWKVPMSTLCKKYSVSDVALRKVCKSMNIPTPLAGYWAKVYAGKDVEKLPLPPLPKNSEMSTKKGVRNYQTSSQKYYQQFEAPVNSDSSPQQALCFLTDEEREAVFDQAEKIELPALNSKAKPQIVSYKPIIKEWKSKDRRDKFAQRSLSSIPSYQRRDIPFLAEFVSQDSLPRIFRLLGALISAIEANGGYVSDDLRFWVRDENVHIEITESQTKIDHVYTKEEQRAIRKYEEDKRKGRYAYEPTNIRKYDYIFNGRLTLRVSGSALFRDSESRKLEDRIDEIFIAMYEESENVRIHRIAYEKKQAELAAEEERKEKAKEVYNEEVKKLASLVNSADDFAIATKIRNYIGALKASTNLTEEELEYIKWAEKKADWFDPTLHFEDEVFGKRKHGQSAESKEVKTRYRYW